MLHAVMYIRPALISRERIFRVVGFLFAALAAVQVVRLTVFSVDPSRTGAAVYPFDQFYVQHSCLSAYFQAAKLGQARVPNLYDETLYVDTLGRFNIDGYLYPPQFCCFHGPSWESPPTSTAFVLSGLFSRRSSSSPHF
jgi:hypothetical protein